jgi:membrane protein
MTMELSRSKYVRLILKLIERLIDKAKKISLPFFDGVPLYDVSIFFWKSIYNGSITTRASAVAFSFFIAFFPGVIFLFTLIPYIPIKDFQSELLQLIKDLVPDATFKTIEDTVLDIIMRPRGHLVSLGFFMALIFSTNGIASMMSAFDATVHSIKRRTWLGQRLTSILLLFILSVLLAIAISLITGGQFLIELLLEKQIMHDKLLMLSLSISKWLIIILLLFFAFSFLYYFAPAEKTKWRFISAGGTLATLLSIFNMVGFSYYLNHFSQYNKLYGSIGTLLVILLLMYFMAIILLIGFELNASIYQAHTEKKQ